MQWKAELSSVDWKSLKTSCGSAEDLPQLILELKDSLEPERRKAIFKEISRGIEHYLSEYQLNPQLNYAVLHVVSILVTMINDSEVKNRREILAFLGASVLSEGMSSSHIGRSVLNLFQSGLNSYISLISDNDPEFSSFIFGLLTSRIWFEDHHTKQIAELLNTTVRTSSNSYNRISAILGFAQLALNNRSSMNSYFAEFESLLLPLVETDNWALRFACLFALGVLNIEQGLEQRVEQAILAELLKAGDTQDDAYQYLLEREMIPDVHWLIGRLPKNQRLTPYTNAAYWYAALLISSLDIANYLRIYQYLIAKLEYPSRVRQFALTILDRVFDVLPHRSQLAEYYLEKRILHDGKIVSLSYRVYFHETRDIHSLSAIQKQALKIVLYAPAVWEYPSNLLQRYGIKNNLEELKMYLNQ